MPAKAANEAAASPLFDIDSAPDSALIRLPILRAILGDVSESTIWRLARSGKLPPIKVSERVTAWRVGDVRAYIDGLSCGAEAA